MEDFEEAVRLGLRNDDESAVVDCVNRMKEAGLSQQEIYERLSAIRGSHTDESVLSEKQDNLLVDVLSRVAGRWCPRKRWLFEQSIPDVYWEEYRKRKDQARGKK